ncbi:permease-like cell division protein FtsX [Microbulbifer sp. OS29]|uniref:Cell division protein FtsX n=1 Tax=Microbulbifer okhotskensis TaxID=2926617 RepID=A0A9X2EKU0_9GAMM|nr:permease-like cell division protein FtsX [Microbulbifer okhotskensis]MCO1332870.1 permease-like cell division protein FtsX [Microbulbifer okhotskensis]
MKYSQAKVRRQSNPAADKRARSTGAVIARTGFADRSHSWLGHHREVAADSVRRFFATPMASVMTALVIAIALALPAALQLGLLNFQRAVAGWDGQPQISVFLHKEATDTAVSALAERLRSDSAIAEVTYVSPEDALAEFEQASGLGDVLVGLGANPLPAVLLLRPRDAKNGEKLQQLVESLRAQALTDSVVLDLAWVQRLAQLTELGQRFSAGLALLLALGVVLVVINTIRLHIESRREEILVVKLVGGTNAFVRRPFLYSGICYGLFGGFLAWVLLASGVAMLSGPIEALSSSYGSSFELSSPGARYLLQLSLGASLLGLLGAWLAVARHTHEIEPR